MDENQQNSFMFYSNFLDAINQLPESERANACYQFCKYALNDKLPDDKALAMFCIGVRYSVHKYQGRGGARIGAGAPKGNKNATKNNALDTNNQNNQNNQKIQKNQNTQTETKTKYNNINIYNNINNIGKNREKKILIDSSFSCSNFDVFKAYIQEMPSSVIQSVENWLKKQKNGQEIPVEFIIKQFFNFAQRSNISIFK